jgi:hypothetical protein
VRLKLLPRSYTLKKGPIPPYTLDEAMHMLQRTKLGGAYLETELPLRSLLGNPTTLRQGKGRGVVNPGRKVGLGF